jgi:hypothetical protein
MFVVLGGELEIIGHAEEKETLIAVLLRGQFSGELNVLSGRRGFARKAGCR